jgi:DNA-binding transcriptional LysR family regulator
MVHLLQWRLDRRNDADLVHLKKVMIAYSLHKKFFEMHRLNLNHLHTYSCVIACGSFSAAGAELGLTQPAVSLQIRQLEQRLNARLIERVGKRVKPTSAGSVLLEHIVHIDAAVENALLDLSIHSQAVTGNIAIGTGATACIHLLPPILQRLRQQFPALEVRVSIGNTEGVLKAVEENRLDLALVTLPAAGRSLSVTPLLSDDFVAIFSTGETGLAEQITPDTLINYPLVIFEAGSRTRTLINQWFAESGIRIKPVMELGSIEAIKEMVAAGLGYSIVPSVSVAAAHHRRGLQIRSLTPALTRTLGIVLRQDKPVSKALRQVVDALETLA